MRYSFVDIETTGGNRDGNKITEIAIINYDGSEITESWSTLINPERLIPWSITQLTGINNSMVESAPRFF
jgi:DNA polymerase III subunit epsilon